MEETDVAGWKRCAGFQDFVTHSNDDSEVVKYKTGIFSFRYTKPVDKVQRKEYHEILGKLDQHGKDI